jgi:hypothetical protein
MLLKKKGIIETNPNIIVLMMAVIIFTYQG